MRGITEEMLRELELKCSNEQDKSLLRTLVFKCQELNQWKDISSAPKDRRIMVWNIIHGVYESQCIPAHEGQVRDEWPHLCWSFPGSGDLKNDPTLKSEIATCWPGPTHWMELPNPPEEK